jgi:hypothetical protein
VGQARPYSPEPISEYRLYGSASPSMSNRYLIWSGTKNRVRINVQSTTYVEVEACGATLCSDPTQGDEPATYTAGCL